MKHCYRHIIAALLLAVFFAKGMAGLASFFSIKLNGQFLVELVHSSEQEESKSIPESKNEGEPNEYFIVQSFGAPDMSFLHSLSKIIIPDSSPEQAGFRSVTTPPPDQA